MARKQVMSVDDVLQQFDKDDTVDWENSEDEHDLADDTILQLEPTDHLTLAQINNTLDEESDETNVVQITTGSTPLPEETISTPATDTTLPDTISFTPCTPLLNTTFSTPPTPAPSTTHSITPVLAPSTPPPSKDHSSHHFNSWS